MATQNLLLIDRKRSRPDIMTTDFDSAEICSWPRFLLIKGTNDERPLCKLSPFAVNKAIVAILGSDLFNIKKLRNGGILVEVDKETQSKKFLKTTKLNLTMDNAIPIDVSPHYSLNTKKVVVKNLGVWFDANFSFANHVRNICKTCFIQIRDLRRVRKHLTDEAAILAANALVSSCLDYCNSLFRSLSSLNMRKLQCIQNTLARIVTNCNKYTRASPILKRLHWLPVESRCIFKTATLVYKFLHSGHPSYFGPLLPIRCGRYSTRYNHPDKRSCSPIFIPSCLHKCIKIRSQSSLS